MKQNIPILEFDNDTSAMLEPNELFSSNDSIRRKKYARDGCEEEARYLVFFTVNKILPLVGSGEDGWWFHACFKQTLLIKILLIIGVHLEIALFVIAKGRRPASGSSVSQSRRQYAPPLAGCDILKKISLAKEISETGHMVQPVICLDILKMK